MTKFKGMADFGFRDELVAVGAGSKVPIFADWETHKVTDRDIDRWDMQQNNVGLRTGYFPTFDIDINIPALVSAVETILEDSIGSTRVLRLRRDSAANRIYEKRAIIYRLDPFEPKFRKMRVSAKTQSGEDIAVELLADGQQVVILGKHPDGSEYLAAVSGKEKYADDLDVVSAASAENAIEKIAEHFERSGCTDIRITGTSKQQAQAVAQGAVTDEHWKLIREIVANIPNDENRHWDDWLKVGFAIRTCAGDIEDRQEEAFQIWEEFSERSPKNNEHFTRHKWENDICVSNRGQVGYGSLVWEAKQNGWTEPAPAAKDVFSAVDLGGGTVPPSKQAQMNLATVLHYPRQWDGKSPPPRDWIVDGWIAAGEVTSVYAPGGTGKSLLLQQLATCRALGVDFLGLKTKKGRTLVLACEDQIEEVWRRQEAINSHYLTDMRTLDQNVGYWSRTGSIDNALMHIDPKTNKGTLTDFWKGVRDIIVKEGFDVVIVDTVIDTFPDNENERFKVNLFVKGALVKLAQETGAAVVFTAHPSRASENNKESDNLSSGSTAWEGSVRQKLGMRRNDDGLTYKLVKNKANYSSYGDYVTLKWERGVFVVLAASMPQAQLDQTLEDYLLDAIRDADKRNIELSSNANSRTKYVPRWAMDNLAPPMEIEDIVNSDSQLLDNAMRRLVLSGKVVNVRGKDLNQRVEIVP
ncbi:hypothetical protein AVM02_07455 [Brucella anthropi]|uniref:AAA family ATPase n=1 Tax=Brucella anthropi TaxID=529 RepID=UPI0039880526